MNIFAAADPHMALLQTGSPVTAVRRAELYLELRIVNNELLVFGKTKEFKVESVGHLGVIKNIKVLRNLTNIIISVNRQQNYFSQARAACKKLNLDIGKVIYGSKWQGCVR